MCSHMCPFKLILYISTNRVKINDGHVQGADHLRDRPTDHPALVDHPSRHKEAVM